MRNLIKKILKESDELNWIKDIQPTFGEVFKSATENDPRIVVYLSDDGTITNIDDENGYAYWRLDRKLDSPEDLLDLAETNINDWDYKDKNYDDWCHFRDVVIKTFFPDMNNLNESDELDWIRDVNLGIELEPNTLYYFNPPLSIEEIPSFANRIINSNFIKNLLLNGIIDNLRVSGDPGVNYFVTKRDLEMGLYGWCSEIDIEGGINSYPRQNPVNAREKFIF